MSQEFEERMKREISKLQAQHETETERIKKENESLQKESKLFQKYRSRK